VNDSYGHDVGDRYIRNTSAAICDVFKNGSIFRIGGDEFVIIIDGADYENADRLFAQLKSKKMKCTSLADIEAGNTSFTVGIALFDRTIDETVGDVIKRADIDMYKNK
jgi:diguanylate cyclase (GGDEF) domain